MELVLEKKVKRYALAAIEDNVCWYLRSLGTVGGFDMVADIEQATKTSTKGTAKALREIYERDMGRNAVKFIIVPVVIDFSLVKEIED